MQEVGWCVLDALPEGLSPDLSRVLAVATAVIDSSDDAIVAEAPDGTVTSWNPAAERLYGYPAEDALGRTLPLVPPERAAERAEVMARLATGSAARLDTVRRHRDGRPLRVVVDIRPLTDRSGRFLGAVTVARPHPDPATVAREAAERHFGGLFRRSDFGMVIADLAGRATAVNPAICNLLHRRSDELLGHSWDVFSHPEDAGHSREMLSVLRNGRDSYSSERRYLRPDGSVVWLRATVNVARNDDDEPLYLMAQLQDVTDRKRMEAEVEHLAYHDGLTGLPNRTLLEDRLDHALAVAARTGSQVGVMFLDLDGFKHVNDARGHAAGDRLLVEVGDRLGIHVRPSDTVARFGGDEFVLVLDDTSVEAITAVAERVIRAMREPFTLDGDAVALHASAGISLSRRGSRPESLLSEADAAMYRAKELGRDQAVVFDDSLRVHAEEMLQGERALRRAIAEHEFVAHYQPVVDLTDGTTVGVEALARWRQADGSLVPPYRFIPLAETSGLIVDLGRSILEQAAVEVARWNSRLGGRAPLWVSVNLSARQLEDEAVADIVDEVLRASGFPSDLLHLEITETVVMHNIRHSIKVLERLKASGVQISIDDFGTGYSSLAYLQNLPVDTLKIDRSFVTHDQPSDHDLSIVKAIISLTDALGMTSVAEGIETAAQRSRLSDLGCRFGQGYLWCPPLPPRDAYMWAQSPDVTI